MRRSKKKKSKAPITIILTGIILIILIFVYVGYDALYKNNIPSNAKTSESFFIRNEISSSSLIKKLITEKHIKSGLKLKFAAKIKRFDQNIKPGKFELKQGMSNTQILNMFLSGNQSPTKITFNNIRTKEQLAAALGKQLLIDSIDIITLLNDDVTLIKNNLNSLNATSVFIPNTYEVYWTITQEELLHRMIRESDIFWNENRIIKAKSLKLTRPEVIILASIVEEEIMKSSEKPIVAGLYINRLKKGYLLQADPTLKFALQDFAKKRILNVDKKVESPYNTYKYKGLPPGPIRIPDGSTIDAVLNYKKHNYLYMCAKADFSGYHHFSKSLVEHNRYARQYHHSLNKNNIYK